MSTALTIAAANFFLKRWRALILLVGYGLGVAVMIVLLAIGEALVTQSRDERLVGGGNVTVLPEGIDLEVLKTGGLGGMFFSIDRARFVYRQLLAAPRFAGSIDAVAPQIDGKLLYVRTADGRELPILAAGEIPSRSAAVAAVPALAAGAWSDDDDDRRWIAPTPRELRHDIDRFHLPSSSVAGDSSWAEWHYFNVAWAGGQRWAFISYLVGGDVPDGRWGGQLLITVHDAGKPSRRFVSNVAAGDVRFSTTAADVKIGSSTVTVLDNGDYRVVARAREEGGNGDVTLDLVFTPAPGAYFPGAALGGDAFESGYVVAALRARTAGSICVSGRCERIDAANGYHDHNWGVWRGVTWEWGAGTAGDLSLVYGRVQPDDVGGVQPLFVYVVDSLGFLGLYRPRDIEYDAGRVVMSGGNPVRVPTRGTMVDVRGADTLRIDLEVDHATITDVRRGADRTGAGTARPYFIQMKGTMRISGRVQGRAVRASGTGFFETYR
jgi:hypothetical protein